MQTVRNERELTPKVIEVPGAEPIINRADYIRCLTDQTVLVRGDTGECFKRQDGKIWPDAGYHVDANGARAATAPEDHTNARRFRPDPS